MLDMGKEILQGWGLDVVSLSPAHSPHFYLSANDAQRAQALNLALTDPDIKAIFSIRGGYGSARLLSMINFDADIKQKFFCGFSDLTTLLFAFDKRVPNIINIHGPHIATAQFTDNGAQSDLNRARLHEILFQPGQSHEDAVSVLRPGKAQGHLIGGCLALIVTLMGTPYEPNFDNAILFIEDVGEKPYQIDRMFTHLKNAGVFDRINGIVLGDMKNCNSPGIDLNVIIKELFEFADFPVVSGLSVGHEKVNLAVRFGQVASIDTDLGKLVLH